MEKKNKKKNIILTYAQFNPVMSDRLTYIDWTFLLHHKNSYVCIRACDF